MSLESIAGYLAIAVMMNKHTTLPKQGIDGLKQNWRSDLQAGFFVFLIALPLCLGISISRGVVRRMVKIGSAFIARRIAKQSI